MTLAVLTRLSPLSYTALGVSRRYDEYVLHVNYPHTKYVLCVYNIVNNVHVVVCLQVLRGRSFLPVREQDSVRIRLRGTAGVRQYGHVQLVQSGAHKKASQ